MLPLSKRRLVVTFLQVAFLLGACRSQPGDPPRLQTARNATSEESPSSATVAHEVPEAEGPSDAAFDIDSASASSASVAVAGARFDRAAQAIFRVAACAGSDEFVPAGADKNVIDRHCKKLLPAYEQYRREWLDVAMPFLAKLRPSDLPKAVVYPFGGGDLVTALATFPDATEFTTVSLEIAGDVRPVLALDNRKLDRDLAMIRDHLGKLFLKAHSRTVNLNFESRGPIPGEVAFAMAALAIFGFEPTSLRYFRFEGDGGLHYLEDDELVQVKPRGRSPFANAEILFIKPGESGVRTLRHIAFDLSDASLRKNPELLKHLDAKGKVAAMTKAASHLLWDDAHFSVIREWLMTHTDWMISDTTGVPPRIAKQYGFVQDFFGQYVWPEPFGAVNNRDAKAFRDLFRDHEPIAFRYGYPDNRSHGHIVVTRKAP